MRFAYLSVVLVGGIASLNANAQAGVTIRNTAKSSATFWFKPTSTRKWIHGPYCLRSKETRRISALRNSNYDVAIKLDRTRNWVFNPNVPFRSSKATYSIGRPGAATGVGVDLKKFRFPEIVFRADSSTVEPDVKLKSRAAFAFNSPPQTCDCAHCRSEHGGKRCVNHHKDNQREDPSNSDPLWIEPKFQDAPESTGRNFGDPGPGFSGPNPFGVQDLKPIQSRKTSKRVPFGINLRKCGDEAHITFVHKNTPATRCIDVNTKKRVALEVDFHILKVNGKDIDSDADVIREVKATDYRLFLTVRDNQKRVRQLSAILRAQ